MQIKEIVKSKTLSHFLITSGGTAINGFLGLLFYIYVARILGPASYGLLSVAIAFIAMMADLSDLGIDTGIIRFLGKYIDDRERAFRFIKLALEAKILIWLVIIFFGWFASPLIANNIFLKEELTDPLRLSLFGIGGALIYSLVTHVLQAWQKFVSWSLVNISMNALRLLALFLLVYLYQANLEYTLLIYIAIPFIGFFITLILLPNFLKVNNEQTVKTELFHYSKWVAMVGILTAIGTRLDTFLTARFLSNIEVGIYSAANQLTVVIPQLIFALATVVAPKLASLDTKQKAINYLKKLQLLVAGIFVIGLVSIPLLILLIPLLLGDSYQNSIAPFILLFIAQLIFLLSLPAHQAIFYYFAKPKLFTYTALGQLIIVAVLGWILIPQYGVIGAALTILISNTFNFLVPTFWVVYNFSKK